MTKIYNRLDEIEETVMSELKALHLKKTYKKRTVVSDVSISVESGSIVGLLGPNGAGKTTSFYMIVGIVSSEDGQVLLDNEDITEKPMHERARAGLGYLPQENSIFRKLTVYQNLMGVVELIPGLNKQEKENRVNELLDEFSVGHLRNNTGMSLSGGERRRVEIARALAASPKFILLDEPFAGVDPISVGEIKEIIVHLKNRGIGILITDHNVRETLDVCERSYIVNAGKIIAQGSAEEVLSFSFPHDTSSPNVHESTAAIIYNATPCCDILNNDFTERSTTKVFVNCFISTVYILNGRKVNT